MRKTSPEIPSNTENNGGAKEYRRKLSRREFLKKAGGTLGGGIFFAGFFSAEISRAWSKEVREGDSWLEGILALRDEALHNSSESAALYRIEKGGQGLWKQFTPGNQGSMTLAFEDAIQQELSSHPSVLKIAHTHPLEEFKEFGLTEEEIQNIKAGQAMAPSMPPSLNDIYKAVILESEQREKQTKTKIEQIVVDPRGIWTFTADAEHAFAKTFFEYDTAVQALKQKFGVNTHEEVLKKLETDELDEETLELREKLWQADWVLYNDYLGPVELLRKHLQEYLQNSIKDPHPDMSPATQGYKELGITAAFQSFDEVRKESE